VIKIFATTVGVVITSCSGGTTNTTSHDIGIFFRCHWCGVLGRSTDDDEEEEEDDDDADIGDENGIGIFFFDVDDGIDFVVDDDDSIIRMVARHVLHLAPPSFDFSFFC